MDRFIDDAQIVELHRLLRMGFNTVQAIQNPIPIVQFRRLSEATGRFEDIGEPVTLIALKFGLREKAMSSQLVPLVDTKSQGDIKYWAEDIDLKPGDRFTYEGSSIEVTAVYPPSFDVVKAEIKLSQ